MSSLLKYRPRIKQQAIARARPEAANLRSRQEQLSADMNQPFNEFVGSSVAMQRVYDTILKVAQTDANVLILGENGTGKALVARALHRNSARNKEVFLSVDMGSISESSLRASFSAMSKEPLPMPHWTATLLDILGGDGKNGGQTPDTLSREEMEEVAGALETIHKRSQGLMTFVDSYRNMTLIPKPQFKLLSISDFFRRVEKLMYSRLADKNISFRWSVDPESLELTADPDLMEQVMINLLLNAIHAVSGRENPRIALSASLSPEGKVTITVEDNGMGIVEEALEKIFIPFFTTKKQGSGIGLSLSRQILRLHSATISAKSKPDEGSVFTVRFA